MKKNKKTSDNIRTPKHSEVQNREVSKVKAFVRKYLTWVVIGGICTVVGAVFGIRSELREMAKESARLDIKIGGFEFPNHANVLIYYICPITEINANYINGLFPMTFTNNSNLDINNIHIRLRNTMVVEESVKTTSSNKYVGIPVQLPKTYKYRRFFNLAYLDKLEVSEQAYCTYTFSPEEGFEYTDYMVSSLAPGIDMNVRQDFLIDTLSPYLALPGYGQQAFSDYFTFHLECTQSNQKPYSFKLGLVVINGRSLNDFYNIIKRHQDIPVIFDSQSNSRKQFIVLFPTYYLDNAGKAQVDIKRIKIIKGEYIPKNWFRKKRKVKFYNSENDELLKTILLKDSRSKEIDEKVYFNLDSDNI